MGWGPQLFEARGGALESVEKTHVTFVRMSTPNEERAEQLRDELVNMASRRAAADFQFLRLIREHEAVVVLAFDTYPRYLAWLCQMSLKSAYEMVRVAKALANLPCIAKELEAGKISYSKVRIVTRVATPETDAKYAYLCLNSPVHFLEETIRAHTKILDTDTPDLERRRYFDMHTDDDGMVVVRGRLAPDEAAILRKAIDAAKSAGADDNCLALTEVATAGIEKLATGDEAILHVENSEHVCTVEGHACSRATADRLICQNPHKRTASDAQIRILKQIQGGTCGYPGCEHTRLLHAHHVKHWQDGGKTVVSNLILLCRKHHRILHEGGYTLRRENGRLVFRNTQGFEVPATGPLCEVPTAERGFPEIPSKPWPQLYPGEYFTTGNNLECSIDLLLGA